MEKRTETVNKFRTTKENMEFLKMEQSSQDYPTSMNVIVEHLLDLGIKTIQAKRKRKNTK